MGWDLSVHITLCGHLFRTGCAGLLVWTGDRYVPGEQVGNAVDGVVGDLGEDVLEIDLRVEAVELG